MRQLFLGFKDRFCNFYTLVDLADYADFSFTYSFLNTMNTDNFTNITSMIIMLTNLHNLLNLREIISTQSFHLHSFDFKSLRRNQQAGYDEALGYL